MFQKISSIEKIRDKKGVSRFSVKILLSQSTETICGGTLLCFRKILLPKIVRDKREG